MSFGYSIGDFIAGANLSYQLIHALLGTRGASVEYQDALMELGCMQQTFLQVGRMTSNPNFSPATINAASHLVLSSMGLIGDFLAKTKRYRERLRGRASGNAVSGSWQKMGWVLFKKEELKALRDTLHVRLSDISVLLATAKFQERMPSNVAQYHDTSTPNPSPPPSYTHLAEDPPEFSTKNPTSEMTVEPGVSIGPEDTKASELEARFARLEEMMAQQRHTLPVYGQKQTERSTDTQEVSRELTQESMPQPGVNENENEAHVDLEGIDHEPPYTANPAEESLFMQFEKFLKSQRQKEIQDSELMSDLQRVLDKHTTKSKDKPIRLKDAVGRKFSFPFHLAATWAGMEDLIKQAFSNVDVIGPHVIEGHYDLIGPNGEIILPQVWETMIEPDWSITMHMWPMPEPKYKYLPGRRTSPVFGGPPGWVPPPPPPPRGWPGPPGGRPITVMPPYKSAKPRKAPSWMSKAN